LIPGYFGARGYNKTTRIQLRRWLAPLAASLVGSPRQSRSRRS